MPATIAGSHLGLDTHANRPAANAAGQPIGALYSCSDHLLVYKTDGSTWSTWASLTGSGIAATLADAAGDMLVASGADAWAKLATPTVNGQAIRRVSGSVAWDLPPAHILDYVEITSPVTVSGTSEGAATTIITGTSQAYAAEPIWVEFYCPDMQDSGAGFCIVHLWDGGTVLGRLGIFAGATGERWPGGSLKVKLTPTAATHQYIVKGQVDASSSTIGAGNKGSSAYMPAFLAVTKA